MSALKHQALSAMMNPHFIFNSLTSIQYFINDDEIEKANEYLSKFAKLLRLNLESAEHGFITIEEELERLKIYLMLEKIRFGHTLTYTLKIDREINAERIQIPNMLIQPFVENAVWHGILPKHGDGEISIKIEKSDNDNLKITITDNGIGFNKGLELKKSDHISKGMNIIEQRLNLLNDNNEKLISVHDVSEYEKDKTGTIVEIILTPKLIRSTG
ncbi:MAG: histidine kinase [Ignavibacteriaceae bacterium]